MAEHKLRVSSKGEIVIPEAIRIKYGPPSGTELLLKPLDENRLIIEKIPKLPRTFCKGSENWLETITYHKLICFARNQNYLRISKG